MAFDSFYGGRQGASFVIVARYETIAKMVEIFSQGGATVDKVNYGEYVIIDTLNKSNPDNGKVYRRGMDYTGDLGGAEYIGQIVGPKGDAPTVTIDHYDSIQGSTIDLSVDDNDLIPGYDSAEDHYNDVIKYAYNNLEDEYGNIIGVKVGFKLPYLMTDFNAESIDPYYTGDLISKDPAFVDENDKWIHPFYQKWQMKIPKGIHGDNSTNIEIIPTTAKPSNFYHDAEGNYYYKEGNEDYRGAYVWTNSGCTQHATNPVGGGWLILPDNYILAPNLGTTKTPDGFIGQTGDVKWVRINYPGIANPVYVKQSDCYCYIIKYTETNFDESTPKYTYISIGEKKDIQKVYLREDGYLVVDYTSAEGQEILSKVLRWLYYNANGTTPDEIGGIQIDSEGTVKVYYNTFTNGERDVQVFEHIAGWIDDVDLGDDGTLTFEYNNGTDPIVFDKKVKWINDIQIQTAIAGGVEGSGDQYIHVIYNNDEIQTIDDSNRIGQPLNYVIDMVIAQGGATGSENVEHQHLLVYYSDPTRRTSNIKYKSPKLNTVLTGWTDLGFVQGEPGGIHNIKNVTSLDELKRDGIWLKPEELDMPAGSMNPTHAGWSVTYTVSGQDPEIYFYDYKDNIWYSIGSLNSSAIDPSYIITTSKEQSSAHDPRTSDIPNLNTNGFWFGKSEVKSAH